jgi:hypothetical protein
MRIINRRGYFFIIDSIIALLIMTLGVVSVLAFFVFDQSSQQTSVTSADVMGLLNVKIRNLNDPYCGVNSNLTRDMNITNYDNSLIEQIAEFRYRGTEKGCTFCSQLSNRTIQTITQNVPLENNFMIKIDNEVVYFRNHTPIENAMLIVPSRKIVHTLYNGTEAVGPHLAEVYVWR